jgi:ligand-binding sensor domain-containing protein/signal transduction histidine kinase
LTKHLIEICWFGFGLLAAQGFAHAQFDIQQHRVERLSVEHGLSQSSVWTIIQDRRGFMWFGTADGLNRYDGYSFKVYRHNAQDPSSLRSNTVWSLCEDHDGIMWVGTAAGLHRFDARTEKFSFLPDDSTYRSTHLRTFIYAILEDRDSNLWIGSVGGLSILNLKNGAIKEYLTSDFGDAGGERGMRVNLVDDAGDVWISCVEHIHRYQRAKGKFVEVEWPGGVAARNVTIYQDQQGTIWLAPSGGGLFALDVSTNSRRHWRHEANNPKSLSSDMISRALCSDEEGRMWIGTVSAGLNVLEPEKNIFTRISSELDRTTNLLYDKVAFLFRDRSDIMWIGYDGSGIVKIDPRQNKFRHVLLPASGKATSGNNFFKALIVDRSNRVWLGMYNQGVAIVDRNTGRVERLSHDASDPLSLVGNAVFALLEDRHGLIWIGTLDGLDTYSPLTKKIRHHALQGIAASDVRGKTITALFEDSSGTIWVGSATSVLRYDRDNDEVKTVLHVGDLDSLHPFAGAQCFAARGGVLWCGTSGAGLLKLTFDGRMLARYIPHPLDSNSLSHISVKSICIDPDGILWIGTEDGLNRFDPGKDTWRVYRMSDGMPNDFIYGVLMDDHRRLWISTNRGIARMITGNPAAFRHFTPEDGLQSLEFNTNVYFKTAEGEMFFGGVNGFNTFFPDSVTDNPHVPRVVITGFKKFDQQFDFGGDFASRESLELSYLESVFSFEFAALEFTNSPKNHYAYKMEGFDKDWIYCGTKREARYTNLDPGEYVFRVKACNNDGVWNETGSSIRVTIIPPFWKTAWFMVAIGTLAMVALGGTVRFVSTRKLRKEIQRLEREKEIQEERFKTRERIARDLHDDLASTVGSASFFIESVKNTLKNAPTQAKEFLDKTSSLLSEAEESMSDIVWSVSPHHDTVESLIARIRLTASDICKANRIKYGVSFPEEIAQCKLTDDVRRGIYLIFKESLANAARHANATLIRVEGRFEGDQFELRVADNGKGIEATTQPDGATKRGHGLRNMRKRAEEIGGDLSIESEPGQGTTVVLRKKL